MAWSWKDFGLTNRIAVTTGTWTGNSSLSTVASELTLELLSVEIHYDASITNNATVTIDSITGANYDRIITTFNNAAGVTDNFVEFTNKFLLPGDLVKVACDVTTHNAYVTIIAKIV